MINIITFIKVDYDFHHFNKKKKNPHKQSMTESLTVRQSVTFRFHIRIYLQRHPVFKPGTNLLKSSVEHHACSIFTVKVLFNRPIAILILKSFTESYFYIRIKFRIVYTHGGRQKATGPGLDTNWTESYSCCFKKMKRHSEISHVILPFEFYTPSWTHSAIFPTSFFFFTHGV